MTSRVHCIYAPVSLTDYCDMFCFCLTDSITDTDCLTLQETAPYVRCDPNTGNFQQIQCNNGLCVCVDPLTGVPTSDFTFPENDESISCDFSKF